MQKPNVPDNEKTRQAALDSYQLLDTLPERIFDDATFIASYICNTPIALVSLIDKDRQWFKSKVGLDANETHRDISFCGHAINEPHQIFEVKNAKEDKRFSDNPLVEGDLSIGFYAGAPLNDSKGMTLGTLCVIDQKPKELNEQQKKALEALARDVVYKIEARKRETELEKKSQVDTNALRTLEKNNFRYQSLIESAPLGIAITNLKGNFVQTNAVFEEMMEYSKEELESVNVAKLTHPEDITETKINMGKLMKGEVRQFTMEKRYISKHGNLKWGRVSSAFVPNSFGNPTYLIAAIEDITESRRLEEVYKLNAERLELALEGTNDGILDWKDTNSDEQWWSPKFHELLGYKMGELNQRFSVFAKRLIHPDDYLATKEAIEACIKNRVPINTEFRLKTKSEEYRWFRGKADVSPNEQGKSLRMSGSVSDIDESKRLAIRLEAAEKFQSKITEIVPSIIYVFNQKTMSNEYANRELGSVMGFSDKEIQAMGSELMPTLCHPDDFPNMLEYFGKVQQMKDEEIMQLEYRMKHKDGDYRWLLSIDTVFERYTDGSVLKHIGIATDITTLKNVEKELSIQAIQLKKRNDDLKQFTYIATHDLKSPIATIKGYLNLLNKEIKDNTPKVALALKHIEKEIQKFTTTQEGLIQAISIREDQLSSEQLNVSELIKETAKPYQAEIEVLEGALNLEVEQGLIIESNNIYLKSILQNLLSNAIKYRSPERALLLNVIAKNEKNNLSIILEDNGLGIDLELQQNRIFGMFNRFHHHSEGSGMGLYIVKNMVERLGGSIDIESEVDKGTRFLIKLNV